MASSAPTRGRHADSYADRVLVGIILGAVATILLWWRSAPAISGFGDWITNGGRVTGLLAGYSMVVLVALMARLPPLERNVGADRLARWHAMGGRYSVSLVTAHGLLILWGYSVTAHKNLISEGGSLLRSYPDVLMATVAGLLLLMVGITSMRAARKRLQYETWFHLHFYTYLAIALAFSHQFSTGEEFVNNKPARIVWAAMYTAVAVAILWYRFITPLLLSLRHQLRVDSVVRESADTISVVVSGRNLTALQAEAGQFFRWRFLTKDLWWVSSPYSLSATVRPDVMRITVKDLGEHSRSLAGLQKGTRIVAEGPYGAMTGSRRTRQKVLLIAGGVGITPLRALFQSLPASPGDLTLVYRASTEDDVLFREELESIARRRCATLHVVTGRRSELGADPLTSASLTRNVPDLTKHDVYICGPEAMATATTKALREAGVPRQHIHHESFAL